MQAVCCSRAPQVAPSCRSTVTSRSGRSLTAHTPVQHAIRGGKLRSGKPLSPLAPPTSTASTADALTGTGLGQSTAPLTEPVQQNDGGKVNWRKLWYAVRVVDDIDPARPFPCTVLGAPLVIWKDGAGAWRCFEDRCAHRAAPLSEGKIWEDGTLLCAYHGWRFNGSGECVAIPQAASPEAEAAACSSAKACVRAHPIKEAHGLLFVWGEGGAMAALEAESAPLPLNEAREEAEASGRPLHWFIKPYMRDVPNDFTVLVEQGLDPAHVDWAHHLVQGDRRLTAHGQWETWSGGAEDGGASATNGHTNGSPNGNGSGVTNSKAGGRSAAASGPVAPVASMGWKSPQNGENSVMELRWPNTQRYLQRMHDGTVVTVDVFFTPMRPGWVRAFVQGFASGPSLLPGMDIAGKFPRWLQHVAIMNPTVDADVVLLHRAEQEVRRQALAGVRGSDHRNAYYLPTASDRLVAAFRRWMEGPGGHGPWGAPLHAIPGFPAQEHDRRKLLDRRAHHTQHCASCRKADTWMQRLCNMAAGLAAAAWAAAAYLAATGGAQAAASAAAAAGRGRAVLALCLLGGLLLVARQALEKYRHAAFDFSDYVHAEKLG